MKQRKLLAWALALALLFCLCPAALAEEEIPAQLSAESPEAGEAVIVFGPEDAAEKFREEAIGPAVYPLTVSDGEIYYAAYEDTVYNNGGTVYNNGGLVYNNSGVVYNNAGVTYNNGGTVYANGGEVFSGMGQVVSTGGAVYEFSTEFQEPLSYRVTLAEDVAPFAELSGLREEEGELWLDQGAVCTVIPKEGFHLFSAESSTVRMEQDETGALQVEPSEELVLRLRFQPDPPQFDKPGGTYTQVHALELSAVPGAEIYYWMSGEAGELTEAELYTAPILLLEGRSITAVAVVEGAEWSEPVTASYALMYVGAPVFNEQPEGYEPEAQPLLLWTVGDQDGTLESVSLSGKNADSFRLEGPESLTVAAGESDDSSYLLSPVEGLAPGSYEAELVFSFGVGGSASLPVSFQVLEATSLGLTVTHSDGSQKELTLHTTADNLLDALLQAKVVENQGEGFLTAVDGETADWVADRAFWALSKDGVPMTTGARDTLISDGEHYELTYTVVNR